MKEKYLKQGVIALLLIFVLTIGGAAGCSSPEEENAADPPATNSLDLEEESSTVTITDMFGREVLVPKDIRKVYSGIPIGTVLVYTLAPEKLVAKNFKMSELEKKYTVESYHDLPVLGTYIVGDTANEEDILDLMPDVILYTGVLDDTWGTKVEEIQERLGIPVVMVDGDLKNVAAAYEFMGRLLGEEERAEQLGEYCRQTLAEAAEIAGNIAEDAKIRVYYATGEDGMMTYAAGNIHSELIEIVGGKNIDEVEAGYFYNQNLSVEQLLKWNPQVIITNRPGARGEEGGDTSLRAKMLENESLHDLAAIKDKHVYEIPCAPFSWFGQPPSAARILGVKWLGGLLYPELFTDDIRAETEEFYKLFYAYDLSAEDWEELTSNALRQ
ncbi:MAG: ABC transporter substrate-binding protein [Firmicutes bacterium]|nr:ABC transporter substrate-binding protein [Bacillota bacterium]